MSSTWRHGRLGECSAAHDAMTRRKLTVPHRNCLLPHDMNLLVAYRFQGTIQTSMHNRHVRYVFQAPFFLFCSRRWGSTYSQSGETHPLRNTTHSHCTTYLLEGARRWEYAVQEKIIFCSALWILISVRDSHSGPAGPQHIGE